MLRRRLEAWLAVAALAAIAACHSVGKYDYRGYDHNATVVVYRSSAMTLAAAPAYVVLDGQVVAKLHRDDYVVLQLAPGRHELRIKADAYPRSDGAAIEARDLDWLYYEAEPNSAIGALAAASVVDPTIIGSALGAMFVKPFLLRPSSDTEFRVLVDELQRVEVTRSGATQAPGDTAGPPAPAPPQN
jgi:hypothetical protein